MLDRDTPGQRQPTEQDLIVADLVGRYIERRNRRETPCVHDLLAVAGEFGESAVAELRAVLVFYEMRLAQEGAGPESRESLS